MSLYLAVRSTKGSALHRWHTQRPVPLHAGFLAVTLDPQSEQPCFSAEVYAHEMGLTDELDDTKLTYALEMVRGLFSAWGAASGAPPYELPAPATPRAR